jgi:hypothetical protein
MECTIQKGVEEGVWHIVLLSLKRACGVDRAGQAVVQGAALQHGAVPGHGPRAGE